VRVSRRCKIITGVIAGVGIALTPGYWLLGGPDVGQLVGGSIQCATGIIALAWAVFVPSAAQPAPGDQPAAGASAVNTGKGYAKDGGRVNTGVRGPLGAASGSARAEGTGTGIAVGPGSTANTGIDYT
jgi:hypothetical protein